MELIKHVRRWNIWRKRNSNGLIYQILVLIGFTHSPTMTLVWLPEEWDSNGFICGLEQGVLHNGRL